MLRVGKIIVTITFLLQFIPGWFFYMCYVTALWGGRVLGDRFFWVGPVGFVVGVGGLFIVSLVFAKYYNAASAGKRLVSRGLLVVNVLLLTYVLYHVVIQIGSFTLPRYYFE